MPLKTNVKYLNITITAALKAGEAILEIYKQSDFQVEMKADNSPLTIADQKSHQIICGYLLQTGLPLLSEEGKEIPYEARQKWNLFWLVDPLDGTKEFISRNGEFTVNIALINKQSPVAGIIYAPVLDLLYAGISGIGCFRLVQASRNLSGLDVEHLSQRAETLPLKLSRQKFTAVASRSHSNERTQLYLESLRKDHADMEITSKGSSLKFCLIAEGSADVYPRFGPTCEWDTAAGHAIVEAAGGRVMAATGRVLHYNKQDLLNPDFIAFGR